jgi:hypothetical protein
MIKLILFLIAIGIFCIYKVVKGLKEITIIDLTQEDYDEY